MLRATQRPGSEWDLDLNRWSQRPQGLLILEPLTSSLTLIRPGFWPVAPPSLGRAGQTLGREAPRPHIGERMLGCPHHSRSTCSAGATGEGQRRTPPSYSASLQSGRNRLAVCPVSCAVPTCGPHVMNSSLFHPESVPWSPHGSPGAARPDHLSEGTADVEARDTDGS